MLGLVHGVVSNAIVGKDESGIGEIMRKEDDGKGNKQSIDKKKNSRKSFLPEISLLCKKIVA